MRLGKIKNFFVIFLVFTLIVSLLVFFNITAKKTILKACNSEISARINDIINTSNEHLMSMDVFYSDFFSVNFDDEKKVSAVIANTGLINQIVLIWNTEIQNGLNMLRNVNFNLTSGMLTGSAALSQFGSEIEINAEVISNCAITYKSQFIKSGINQTLHRLILYTEIQADIVVPYTSDDVIVSQEIVLAETIIPGSVPQSYLIGDSSVDFIDLIP